MTCLDTQTDVRYQIQISKTKTNVTLILKQTNEIDQTGSINAKGAVNNLYEIQANKLKGKT